MEHPKEKDAKEKIEMRRALKHYEFKACNGHANAITNKITHFELGVPNGNPS